MKLSKYIYEESDNQHEPLDGKHVFASFMHILTMVVSLLIMLYAFFICIAGFMDSIDSVNKYYEFKAGEDIGIPESERRFLHFIHYLLTDGFLEYIFVFLLLVSEFKVYIRGYRSINSDKPIQKIMLLLTAMLAIHTVAWIHSNNIPRPSRTVADWSLTENALLSYRSMTHFTIIPCWLYFFSYLCRWSVYRSDKKKAATQDAGIIHTTNNMNTDVEPSVVADDPFQGDGSAVANDPSQDSDS